MKKNLFLFLTLCLGLLASCKEPDTPNNPEEPKDAPVLEMTIDEVTSYSLTFTIASETANKFGYRVSLASEPVPSVEELMSDSYGALDKSIQFTIEDLTPNTEYKVYAVVGYNDLYSEVGALSITTKKASEDPNFKFIELIEAKYTSFKFKINGGESYYKFIPVEKAMLDAMSATPEAWLDNSGIVDQGDNEYLWEDGLTYKDVPMSVAPGREYVIIAGLSDQQGNVIDGVDTLHFFTPSIPESDAQVSIAIEDIASTSVSAYVSIDEAISSYYVYVRDCKWFDDIISQYGESMINTLIKYPSSGAPTYADSRSVSWEGLMPSTAHYFAVLGIDGSGNEVLVMEQFTTSEPSGPAPVIKLEATPNSSSPHSILDLKYETENAIMARWAIMATSDLNDMLNGGSTLESIIDNYGTTLTEEQFAASQNGGAIIKLENLWRSTNYTIVAAARSNEYVQTTISIEAKTPAKEPAPRVESELFSELVGTWTLTYDCLDNWGDSYKVENVEVIIAAGADDASAQEYRDQNRLVAMGYQFQDTYATKPYEFHGPQELISDYGFDESLAYRDYGPKFFFEIAEGDVVTVPTSASDYMAYYTTDLLYFLGCDFNNKYIAPVSFPVEVSADRNTITIKQCVIYNDVTLPDGGVIPSGNYRPAVLLNQLTFMYSVATSDIVLTRVQ